jgi:hypothetical protein
MGAFVPAMPNALGATPSGFGARHSAPTTHHNGQPTLPPISAHKPIARTAALARITALGTPHFGLRSRSPATLAASLREPPDESPNPTRSRETDTRADLQHPQVWGQLVPSLFRSEASEVTDNSDDNTADIEASGPSTTQNPSTNELESDSALFLNSITGSVEENNNASRLPIPGSLGNLFGRENRDNIHLNNITLQTPWQRKLYDKDMMTFLKLGLVSRFVYQQLAPGHHETQINAFGKTLTSAGYQLRSISVGDNLWGTIAHRKNEVILCFRGTAFWDDMWRNIQFWPSLDKTVPENETTHHGMSHVFEQLWPIINKALTEIAQNSRRPLQVYIAGHSLGGSFAKLTALRLSNKQQENSAAYKADLRLVCTFGAPKTFFMQSAKRYRALGLDHKTITITQHQDIVPELPPNFLSPYETVGNRLYITRDGALWYKPENGCIDQDKFRETPNENGGGGRPNRWVSDHVLDSYILVLDAHKYAKLPKPLPPGSCPTPQEQMIKLKEH